MAWNSMKPVFVLLMALGLVSACKREDIHQKVEENLSSREVTTNTPQLGTDPNVRVDTRQGGTKEVTAGATEGSTSTPRGADTQGGGSATGAGGGGPGYYGGPNGSATNAPK